MNNFLTRIGRKPLTKLVLPTTGIVTSAAYITYHTLGLEIPKGFLTASTRSGEPEEISAHLSSLIESTLKDLKGQYAKPFMEISFFKQESIISWFMSSTIEPITIGLFDGRKGAAIGLPAYYNFTKPADLNPDLLDIKKFKLFNFNSKEKTDETLYNDEVHDYIASTRVDAHSDAGKDYIDSMLLSDKAKKFAIARQIFEADSYRVIFKTLLIMTCLYMPISLSRFVIFKRRLMSEHISKRQPLYIQAGILGIATYSFMNDQINLYYTLYCDQRAYKLSDDYREGAIEFLSKLQLMNKALARLDPEYKGSFDSDGNRVNPIFRTKYVPLSRRLSSINPEDNKENSS